MTVQQQFFQTQEQQSTSEKNPGKPVRILSLDGGGIRGIVSGTILAYIEKELRRRSGNEDARLCDYFDMIAGNSTGGILTCCYLTPAPGTNGKKRPMKAEDALNLYLKHGKKIFSKPFGRRFATLFGLSEEKYSARALEKYLQKTFANQTLSDMVKPCLIPAYDISRRRAVFFNKLDAKNGPTNFPVWQIARATSAAPTYFEPALTTSGGNHTMPLIDGGMFANNPAMCAFTEARKTRFSETDPHRNMIDFPQCQDIFMVSIGTGNSKKAYTYSKMKSAGILGWTKPVIDIMMSSSVETVDYQLKQMFKTCQLKNQLPEPNYIRLSPSLGMADDKMDNVKKKNLKALHQAGLQYIADHLDVLNRIVDRIMETAVA